MNVAERFVKAFYEGGLPIGGFDFRLPLAGPLTGALNMKAVTVAPPAWAEYVGVQAGWTPALSLRRLIPPGRTTQAAVHYHRETSFTNNAAAVIPPAAKPESAATYEDKTSPVATIAHWMLLSTQLIDDAPALEAQIQSRLLFGLALAEENQLINGTGMNGQLEGLLKLAVATTGVTAPVTAAALFGAVAKAIGEINNAGYRATGVVLNPADFIAAAATPSAGGVYPFAPGENSETLWTVPLALSSKMPTGQFVAGAFNPGCQIFDREDASVQLSTEDRDNFVNNLMTALAEQRLAFAIYQPGAFRKAG